METISDWPNVFLTWLRYSLVRWKYRLMWLIPSWEPEALSARSKAHPVVNLFLHSWDLDKWCSHFFWLLCYHTQSICDQWRACRHVGDLSWLLRPISDDSETPRGLFDTLHDYVTPFQSCLLSFWYVVVQTLFLFSVCDMLPVIYEPFCDICALFFHYSRQFRTTLTS